MGMANEFDTIVIGAGYGGLAGAAYLSKAGEKVALLEAHATIGGCAGYFRKGEFSFEAGATTLNGLGEGGPLARLASDFSLPVRWKKVDPAIEIHFSGKTLRRLAAPDDFADELGRVFGVAGASEFCHWIDTYSDELWRFSQRYPMPPQSIIEYGQHLRAGVSFLARVGIDFMRPFSSVLPRDWLRNAALCSVFDELLLISAQARSGSAPAAVGVLGMGYPADMYYPVGGISAMGHDLGDRLVAAGGELSLNDRAIEIRKSSLGYQVRSRKGMRECRRLILAVPIWNCVDLFVDDEAKAVLRRRALRFDEGWGAVTAYFGVRFDRPPGGLYHQIHFDRPAPRGVASGSVFVSFSAVDDRSRAPSGYQAVTISTHANISEISRDRHSSEYAEFKLEVGDFIMDTFRRQFGRNGIVEIVEERVGTPLSFERFTRRHHGRVGGIPWKVRQWPMRRIHSYLPLDEVYLLGDTALPGQGVAGVVMGAQQLSDRLTR